MPEDRPVRIDVGVFRNGVCGDSGDDVHAGGARLWILDILVRRALGGERHSNLVAGSRLLRFFAVQAAAELLAGRKAGWKEGPQLYLLSRFPLSLSTGDESTITKPRRAAAAAWRTRPIGSGG